MQVISRARAGDRQAFAALFEQYKNLVYKTAYLMLGDAAAAEDALQEVFVRMHRSLGDYDPRQAAFTTWLHRLTLNHCLNCKRKVRPAVLSLDEAVEQTAEPNPSAGWIEQAWVHQAVLNLSAKQRAVIVLRFYWELSYDEIAQVLDVPLGTVKSRLDLALKTLRSTLASDQESSPALPWQAEVL